MSSASNRPPSRNTVRATLKFVARQIALALPFVAFFAILNGGTAKTYWMVLRAALVFSFAIGLAVRANEHWILPTLFPRLCAGPGRARDGGSLLWHAGSYALVSFLASVAAAYLVHFTIIPGFMGDRRSIVVFLFFTILFTGLFMSFAYAVAFHRSNVERARNEERMRSELARAELRALRAQINPHFLFNTLNSIASLISIDPLRAETMTEELAEVFRYALRASERERTPLSEELAFVRSYLDIERARMGERLRVEEEVDARALGCDVPTLLLQPLVENAVQHGIAPRPEGGRVRIQAMALDGRLTLEVEDDGPGLSPQALDSGGFGLRSVRGRLRVLGAGHELEVETPATGGTLIRIRLPISRAEEAGHQGSTR